MNDKVPVTSTDDVYKALPDILKGDEPAPVRDALVACLTEIFKSYQPKARYAAAQSDSTVATGIYLQGFADDHNVSWQPNESDASLRSRIFDAPLIVTPSAIIAAINNIVSPYSDVLPQMFEEIDCNFITDDTASYDSTFVGATARYPDRLYPDDAAENDGYVRTQSEAGGFWTFGDNNGRYFVVRIPQLDAVDTEFAWVTDADPDESFISNGADASGSESDGSVITFMFASDVTSDELYAAVVNEIERIKGQGFRFQVYVDPTLV